MKALDAKSTKAGWLILLPLILLAWEACSDNGVSVVDGSLCASDSSCKAGLRILVPGQWWEEFQYDTLVSTRDSGNSSTTRRVYDEHHKYSEVSSAYMQYSKWYYRILTRDTLLRPGDPRGDSIAADSLLLIHSDTMVEYDIPANNIFIDTLKFAALKLPPQDGGQWTVLSQAIDTTSMLFVWRMLMHLDIQSDGSYGANGICDFGGKSYACRTVNRITDFSLAMISDTVIVIPIRDTLARKGDTIATSFSHSVQSDHFNFDLSVSFWSRELETKLDTNYIDSSTTRENNVKYTTLHRYSDPRRPPILGN